MYIIGSSVLTWANWIFSAFSVNFPRRAAVIHSDYLGSQVLSSLLTQSFTATSHSEHGHTGADGKPCLCHNVRMRVELSALVNDFFARDNIMTGSHGDSDDCSDTEDESDLESNVRHNQYDLHQQPSDMSRTQSPMSISSLVTSSSFLL